MRNIKRKINTIIKILLALALLGILVGLAILWLFYLENYSHILEGYFYWWFLFVLIYILWQLRVSSKQILLYSLIIYIFASFLVLINLTGIAEMIMRISFIGFMFGVVKAFIEYRESFL